LHWRLYFVDALLLVVTENQLSGGVIHRFRHSPSRIPPLGWRRMTVRGAHML
jgi:hypothetical protein